MSRSGLAADPASMRPTWATRGLLGLLAGLFVVAACCDQAGLFRGIDQYAVSHLMPALRPGPQHAQSIWFGLYSPFRSGLSWWVIVLDVWVYPCSVLISGLIVAGLSVALARRGDHAAALALGGCWIAGNLAEIAGKGLVRRPALYSSLDGVRYHIPAFDGSFPSGHMIRGIIVVFGLWLAGHGVWRVALGWFLPVGPMLVAASAHTPSDVVGGALMGLVLVGCAGRIAAYPPLAAPSRREGAAGG